MKNYIISLYFAIIPFVSSGQTNSQLDPNFPMNGKEANSPGNYELISRANNTVINSGDTLTIDIMITGYGKITQSKLAFYPSGEILDIEKSKVYYDIGEKAKKIVWGVTEHGLVNEGVMIDMSSGNGLRHENWPSKHDVF